MGLKENIKTKRTELDLTLDDVSKYIGVSRQTVYKYESGIISNVPSDKIESMAELFKTTPAALMGWGETKKEEYVAETIAKYAKEINGDQMIELLRRFNKLSEEDKNLALQLIGKMNGGK
jgi:transcriptional regulator with XRE-family HTH domain